jgi:hypothetical protein
MTPSEMLALGQTLEALERPKARARQEAGIPYGRATVGSRGPEVNDIVGHAIGISGPTYKRAKAVVEATETTS